MYMEDNFANAFDDDFGEVDLSQFQNAEGFSSTVQENINGITYYRKQFTSNFSAHVLYMVLSIL